MCIKTGEWKCMYFKFMVYVCGCKPTKTAGEHATFAWKCVTVSALSPMQPLSASQHYVLNSQNLMS